MKLAIGTLRAPKIDGIKAGVSSCPYFDETADPVEYITQDVSSDISHTPLTIEEVIQGAKNRVANLKRAGVVADYYVGIEGGVTRVGKHAYAFGVVYIEHLSGEGHFGFSPMVEVPHIVEHKLFEEGKELGPVMGELSGRTDIRSENGSIGAWTNDMVTRADEFEVAFKAAIAPFFNEYYRL